jgi:hypothetical protein
VGVEDAAAEEDRMTTVEDVETAIARITPAATVEQVADVMGRMEVLARKVREAQKVMEETVIAYIEENGPFEIGPVRWYVRWPDDTKSLDNADTLEATVEASGGDVRGASACLSAQPFRIGACRKLLAPDVFNRCFRTERRARLF